MNYDQKICKCSSDESVESIKHTDKKQALGIHDAYFNYKTRHLTHIQCTLSSKFVQYQLMIERYAHATRTHLCPDHDRIQIDTICST